MWQRQRSLHVHHSAECCRCVGVSGLRNGSFLKEQQGNKVLKCNSQNPSAVGITGRSASRGAPQRARGEPRALWPDGRCMGKNWDASCFKPLSQRPRTSALLPISPPCCGKHQCQVPWAGRGTSPTVRLHAALEKTHFTWAVEPKWWADLELVAQDTLPAPTPSPQ